MRAIDSEGIARRVLWGSLGMALRVIVCFGGMANATARVVAARETLSAFGSHFCRGRKMTSLPSFVAISKHILPLIATIWSSNSRSMIMS
jgi:NAD/NADP transhydrogenase beta subunit